MAKKPFEKSERIASAPSIENLQGLLVKAFFGSAIRIEGEPGDWTVHNATGLLGHIGIFKETTRSQERFWAYFKS